MDSYKDRGFSDTLEKNPVEKKIPYLSSADMESYVEGIPGELIQKGRTTSNDGKMVIDLDKGTITKTDGITETDAFGNDIVTEDKISLSDVLTNNSSRNSHGFLPKLSGIASTFLAGDGVWRAISSILYTDTRFAVGTLQRDMTAASGNVGYTGVGFTPKVVIFLANVNATDLASWGFDNGTTKYCIANFGANTVVRNTTHSIELDTGAGVGQYAAINSLDTDGFTLAWEKFGAPGASTGEVFYLAFR